MSIKRWIRVRRVLAYLDECERELKIAEALVAQLSAEKCKAMADDIADLQSMRRDVERRRKLCGEPGLYRLH